PASALPAYECTSPHPALIPSTTLFRSAVSTGANDSVAVGKGDVIVCTYTNTRKQGSIELKKDWPGTKGDVTLNIGTSAGGHQTDQQILSGTNGTTGANTVDTGTFFVSETVTNASEDRKSVV